MTTETIPAAATATPAADSTATTTNTETAASAGGKEATSQASGSTAAEGTVPPSLFDAGTVESGEKPAAEGAAAKEGAAADAPKWHYADGTPGKGDAPEWFQKDKYKTVEEQAKAYTEAVKKLGAFTGPPKDGKYEFKSATGKPQLDEKHELTQRLNEWAVKRGLNQEGYSEALGMLSDWYVASQPNMKAIKQSMGRDVDTRLTNVSDWVKANMPELHGDLQKTISGYSAPFALKTIEAIIAKTRSQSINKPAEDTVVPSTGRAAYEQALAAKDAKGNLRIRTDKVYAAKIERDYANWLEQNR
jgi:hypothetical protein